jgi:uncharacterized Zn finger protein
MIWRDGLPADDPRCSAGIASVDSRAMGQSEPLSSADQLKRATDARSWQRGLGYYDEGRVEALVVDQGVISGRVAGRNDYHVQVWSDDGEVIGRCSCPMGDAGVFCKHCVALGLTYLAGQHDRQDVPRDEDVQHDPDGTQDLRAYLSGMEQVELVDLILSRLPWDDELRRRLTLRAARADSREVDLTAYRSAITEATRVGRGQFIDYYSAGGFARGIEIVIDSIDELIDDGASVELIRLVDYAIRRCEKALGHVDDSNGEVGSLLERLAEMHHRACARVRPNPAKLAKTLFRWEIESEFGTFHGAAETYADLLGEEGLAEYHKLANERWQALPALKPGEDRRSFDPDRFRITSIMESLARASGDIDQLVAVMSKDLACSYQYLRIAGVLQEADRADEALDWAQKGLAVFTDRPDSRLEDFVADQLHQRGEHDQAMALIWAQFARQPELGTYQHLYDHAQCFEAWSTWRSKALDLIEQRVGAAMRQPAGNEWGRAVTADHSLIVEIYLWEGDVETAWREAQLGGCSNRLWMRLAEQREPDHPADVLPIYQRQIEPIVSQTNKQAYREATDLMLKIQQLMHRLDAVDRFAEYLAEVRATHKRKRNFMAMLDQIEA